MLQGFKAFIARGHVVDLAVGVVIGGAFTAIVTSLVEGVLTPLIAAIFGAPDISGVGKFVVNEAHFSIGLVLQAVLNFLLVSAALYFVVVVPINRLSHLRKKGAEPEPPAPSEDVLLLQEIRDLLAAGAGRTTPNASDPGDGTARNGTAGDGAAGAGTAEDGVGASPRHAAR
ncbi:large conductance mechanosensitive channel protein MscL [Puerhibacterium sp. TATVAM-FAB25]|uniref:large conductance mechanosensitive channel protein MscL n=1 Tax=Puerhibacterium sp. TATVAM-FAB25 TaxID=3093699 RepID=UPI0039786619